MWVRPPPPPPSLAEASAKADYPIFMAVSKKAGKDNSGDYVYKKDQNGNYVHDARGRKVLDHDLDEIAEGFIKFAKEQVFSFWR